MTHPTSTAPSSAVRPSAFGRRELLNRLLDVFVQPGQVFDDVAAAGPCRANGLVPLLLAMGVATIVFLARPAPVPGPDAAVIPSIEPIPALTDLGAATTPAPSSAWARSAGLVVIVAGTVSGTLWSAFVLWLAGRWFLRTRFRYWKAVEVVALATLIETLGAVVGALVAAATGDGSTPSALSVVTGAFTPETRAGRMLAAVGLFHLWTAAVLSIGLSKLAAVPVRAAAVWVVAYWIVLRLALVALG